MVLAGNKAKRLLSVNYITKTIHHHLPSYVYDYMSSILCRVFLCVVWCRIKSKMECKVKMRKFTLAE